jgi:hypothetical protein
MPEVHDDGLAELPARVIVVGSPDESQDPKPFKISVELMLGKTPFLRLLNVNGKEIGAWNFDGIDAPNLPAEIQYT